jgi:hypothetical protein
MTKEELIQFLKDNLKIETSTINCGETTELDIRLYLGEEIISSSFEVI